MAAAFDRDQLLAAFDGIGLAAVAAQTRLDIAVYGGSALMLASNFRFSTEDVDIAEIGQPWPAWLSAVVVRIAAQNGWSDQWLNDAVSVFLSPQAKPAKDLLVWGTFPRGADKTGLTVFVPTARYLLALKLKALRVAEFQKGTQDMADIAGLARVLGIKDVDEAIGILTEFYPKSTADVEKARFVLRHIMSMGSSLDAPRYPRRDL
ncbi:MAG: hypothetical protein QOG83_184 [Alphaproteobacteria bacterium]|nr:hypothetical protein [Alphaproteobacteria bacterium]